MSSIDIKIKLLTPEAKVPMYAHIDDAGMDLFSTENGKLLPGDSILIKTGISMELPPNTEAQIRPRSSLALNYQVTVLNSPGTVDEGYRGEIGVILINHGKKTFNITPGMRIAQMVVKNVLKATFSVEETLNESQRGSGGFGSTGMD